MKKYRIEIKWTIILFVISLLWIEFEKSMGWHSEKIGDHARNTMLFTVPVILVYVQALRDKRDNILEGKMTWKQGFTSGMIIASSIALLSPLTQWLIHNWISPEYFPTVIAYSLENDLLTKEAAETYFSYKSYAIQSVFGALFLGLLFSSIVSLFVRKK